LPNYDQQPQFRFLVPKQNSKRLSKGNVISLSIVDSVANRFSIITVYGGSRGNSSSYGKNLKHKATVKQGPGQGGVGGAFFFRKRLLINDSEVSSRRDALERAKREMSFRDAEKLVVEITVKGHSMARRSGDVPALFAFDTMAELEIEEIDFKGQFLITSVVFTVDRQAGETTQIKLVPKGTDLVS
jgi:prophage tail gpP-like protein